MPKIQARSKVSRTLMSKQLIILPVYYFFFNGNKNRQHTRCRVISGIGTVKKWVHPSENENSPPLKTQKSSTVYSPIIHTSSVIRFLLYRFYIHIPYIFAPKKTPIRVSGWRLGNERRRAQRLCPTSHLYFYITRPRIYSNSNDVNEVSKIPSQVVISILNQLYRCNNDVSHKHYNSSKSLLRPMKISKTTAHSYIFLIQAYTDT